MLTGPSTYNAVSVANGLVYAVDSAGFLNVYDADNGMLQIEKRDLAVDTGESMTSAATSSGVAIARGTAFVAATSHVIALRPSAVDRGLKASLRAPRLASDQGSSRSFWLRVGPARGSDPIEHFQVDVRREGRKSSRYRRIASRAKAGRLTFEGRSVRAIGSAPAAWAPTAA